MQHNFTTRFRQFLIRHAGWIYFLLGCLFISCRSTRDTSVSADTVFQSESSIAQESYQAGRRTTSDSTFFQRDSTASDWNIKISYGDDGKIREIQASGRDVAIRGMGGMVFREANDDVKKENTSGSSKTKMSKSVFKTEKLAADSRPVQGVDWLYIALGIGAVLGVIIGVYYLKNRFL